MDDCVPGYPRIHLNVCMRLQLWGTRKLTISRRTLSNVLLSVMPQSREMETDQLSCGIVRWSNSFPTTLTAIPILKATLIVSTAIGTSSVTLLARLTAVAVSSPMQMPTMRLQLGSGYGSWGCRSYALSLCQYSVHI
jgi:hypothetical protein